MKAISLFSILLFALVHASLSAQTGSALAAAAPVPPSLDAARTLAEKGHLDEALKELAQLPSATPGAERLRGMILYQKEDFPLALEAFTHAEALDPNDREATEMHGLTLFRRGLPAEALPFLEKAHANVPLANLDPHYVLGLCYIDLKRFNEARQAFASYYNFPPDSAEAHLLLARLLLRRGRAPESAAEVARAIELNPRLPGAHLLLGEAELAIDDQPAALAAFEAELKIDPLNGAVYDRIGDACLRAGNNERAQMELNRAILLEPNTTAPYILLAQTLLNLKQPTLALHYLNRALRMDPSNYITHNLLAQAYKATDQLAEANREFKTVAQLRARLAQEER